MYIDQILRRTSLYDEIDPFDEAVECVMRGSTAAEGLDDPMAGDEEWCAEKRRQQALLKIRNRQTEVYFKKFVQALQLEHSELDPSSRGLCLSLVEFPLRILFLDQFIAGILRS